MSDVGHALLYLLPGVAWLAAALWLTRAAASARALTTKLPGAAQPPAWARRSVVFATVLLALAGGLLLALGGYLGWAMVSPL